MKFEDAMEKLAREILKGNPHFTGFKPETARTMAAIWSAVAIAENKLDDIAIIDLNNNIVSIPLKEFNNLSKENIVKENPAPETEKIPTEDKKEKGIKKGGKNKSEGIPVNEESTPPVSENPDSEEAESESDDDGDGESSEFTEDATGSDEE